MSKGGHSRVRFSANPVRQPAPRPNPQCPIRIRQQRANEIIRQPVCRREGVNTCPMNPVQPIRSSHPQVAIWRRRQRQNHVAQQPVLHRIGPDLACPVCAPSNGIQSAAGSPHPKSTRAIFHYSCGVIRRKPIARVQRVESLIAQNVQPARLRSHPKVAFAILHNRQHRSSRQRISHRQQFHLAIHPPRQAAVGPNPQRSLAVRNSRLNASAGQFSSYHPPLVASVLAHLYLTLVHK